MSAPSAIEQHLLYVLLDSNLPTGGFVASSGLESYAKHGFLAPAQGRPTTKKTQDAVLGFVDESLRNYASGTLAFVRDAWVALSQVGESNRPLEDGVIEDLLRLDQLYEAMTLNHVTRRSSTAQGIALLTLCSKSLAPPTDLDDESVDDQLDSTQVKAEVAERFKRMIRKGETHGHLPICWGLLTCASGLGLDRTLHLHLFLHARSVLSSAVRLNLIGPYSSTQMLLHPVRPMIERELQARGGSTTGVIGDVAAAGGKAGDKRSKREEIWAWADEEDEQEADGISARGPAMTWPLGELILGRHDLQHTRIFNS